MSGVTAPDATSDACWAQTASGRRLDLARPVPDGLLDVWRDICVPLSTCPRFAGHYRENWPPYFVAQHCVIGGDYLLAKYQGKPFAYVLALAFLLHENHEAIVGDWTRPLIETMERGLRELAAEQSVDLKTLSIKELRRRVIDPIDAATHRAAGLDWPLDPRTQGVVHNIDARLLMRERADLLAAPPARWDARLEATPPLDVKGGRIAPMTSPKAAQAWMARYDNWSARVRAGAA